MKNGRRLLIANCNHCLQGLDGGELGQAGVLEQITKSQEPDIQNTNLDARTRGIVIPRQSQGLE